MNVLQEIVTWSTARPLWQRDALRRIVERGALAAEDARELARLCKARHGITDPVPAPEPKFLVATDLPAEGNGPSIVTLSSVSAVKDVNALAPNQTLDFGATGITAIYGDNGSGKSGYTRILKRACRARGEADGILPNVASTAAAGRPTATITYSVGGATKTAPWQDGAPALTELGRVSVFDAHCADVYISEKTDVAFRPFGLDIFDKLAAASEQVKRILDEERQGLERAALSLAAYSPTTAVGKLLAALGPATAVTDIDRLAILLPEDEAKVADLRTRALELRAYDPKKKAMELRMRAQRLAKLASLLRSALALLGTASLEALFAARDRNVAAAEAARLASGDAFGGEPLPGVAGEAWRGLWEAARRYSETVAYVGKRFPLITTGARCVLCQQELAADGASRMERFEKFVQADTQRLAAQLAKAYADLRRPLDSLAFDDESLALLDELANVDTACGTAVRAFVATAAEARIGVARALEDGTRATPLLPTSPLPALNAILASLEAEAKNFDKAEQPQERTRIDGELAELEARVRLKADRALVLAEIDRRRKIAALQAAVKDTDTVPVTRKSTELTKAVVTQALCDAFQQELGRLHFSGIEVELQPAGAQRGTFYHQLRLKYSTRAELPKIVSDGEARCLALAAFLAELSIASHKSAIIFDDPVCSLDHLWRREIAERLVQEAKERQVIVFSHDIVFLLLLKDAAERLGVPWANRYLRRDSEGAGVCTASLPWPALPVKNRVGDLKAKHQRAATDFRKIGPDAYEPQAKFIYGLLRETWERAIEEVLLGGVVERFRPSIETKRLQKITDITSADYEAIETGMSKCSTWLPGHDKAAAYNAPVPGPDELKADIDALETWVAQVNKRR